MTDILHNLPEQSVTALSSALKKTVEEAFSRVRVRGEISGFKRAASGHLYLTLKDEKSAISAVCWRGVAARLSILPEDGMDVICTGRITTYPGRSQYQLVIDGMELAGEGALLKLLEDRRKKLAAEGLFDAARKKPIPFLPQTIGVITSPTGSVIRDILHRLSDRFPSHVLVWPVAVQGEKSAEQVSAAIDGFNALAADDPNRPDILIVARGGGSLEDLWPFNEENVVRAVAASDIPVISAVGHETDTMLIDYAADLRAPTPTGAAEKAVPVRRDLIAQIQDHTRRLGDAFNRIGDERRIRLDGLARGLIDPVRLMEEATQRLDDRDERLSQAWRACHADKAALLSRLSASLRSPTELVSAASHRLERAVTALTHIGENRLQQDTGRLQQAAALLESYSFKKTLERGYVLVRNGAGAPLTTKAAAASEDALSLVFADGELGVVPNGAADTPPPTSRRRKKPPKAEKQGELF